MFNDLLAADLSAAGSKRHPQGINYVCQLRYLSKRLGTSKQMLQLCLSPNVSQLLLLEKVIFVDCHHTIRLNALQ